MGGGGQPALLENPGRREPSSSSLLEQLGGYSMWNLDDGKTQNPSRRDSDAGVAVVCAYRRIAAREHSKCPHGVRGQLFLGRSITRIGNVR